MRFNLKYAKYNSQAILMSFKGLKKDTHSAGNFPDKKNEFQQVGEPLGSFVGYLRRPKSSSSGLTALFFGENGEDADVIAALHLTKFLDQAVKVTVWMMKDKDGRLMKKNDKWPKLSEFVGLIKRPIPSPNGQVAQFFSENGANADAASLLNQTSYLDALVYVEMHVAKNGMTALDVLTEVPIEEIEDSSSRMTSSEVKQYNAELKNNEEALKVLRQSGFFRQSAVLNALGTPLDFKDWLSSQPCSLSSEACDCNAGVSIIYNNIAKFSGVPLCNNHLNDFDNGVIQIPGGKQVSSWVKSQCNLIQGRWVNYRLYKKLGVKNGEHPTPGAIYSWAVENGLKSLVPTGFLRFLNFS